MTPPPEARLTGLQLAVERGGRAFLLGGLEIRATTAGLAVLSPTGRVVGRATWPSVSAFEAHGSAVAADGRRLQVLVLGIGDRRHRFLVTAPDLAVFLAAVTAIDPAVRLLAPAALRRPPSSPAAQRSLPRGGPLRRTRTRTRTRRRPRHAATPRVRPAALAGAGGLLLVLVAAITVGSVGSGGASPAVPNGPIRGDHPGQRHEMGPDLARALAPAQPPSLPAATAPPAPAPPTLAAAPALRAHEIFGFVPYWTLGSAGGFDLAHLTTLAYFGVDVNGDGTVAHAGPGWDGYQSQALADLVTRAHGAGDRVVLAATCFGQGALDQLAGNPAAQSRLATTLTALVSDKHLDGVNLDFEGLGSRDRAGIDRTVATVATGIRQADAHWQVTMDTYASSAGDPTGFYDIAGLAPSVDAFFVMAYDMNDFSRPSPTSPLTGPGFTVTQTLRQYGALVPGAKVILGLPYYGYEWPTAGPGLGDPATGPATPLTYAQLAAGGHPVYWDPVSQTPWTSFRVGNQWFQVWMDDPTSLALKARLADSSRVAGLGIWALGMDGDLPAMLAALQGNGPVVKDLPAGPGPTAPTSTTTPGSGGGAGAGSNGPASTTTSTTASTTSTTAVDPGSTTTSTTSAGGSTSTTTSTSAPVP